MVSSVGGGGGINVGGTATSPSVSVNFGTLDDRYARSSHGHGGTTSFTNATGHSHTVSVSSSRAFKTDISDYSFDTTKLLKTNLVKFKYLNSMKDLTKNFDWEYGYIAEELQELGLLEPLAYNASGEPNRVNYSLIGVLTLELVKEQQRRIEELEKIVYGKDAGAE